MKTIKQAINNDECIKIPILVGSLIDLKSFEFTFKDIAIVNVKSRKFQNYLNKYLPFFDKEQKSSEHVKDYLEHLPYSGGEAYAIIKINPLIDYNYSDIFDVWRMLLVLYPSDLQIIALLEYISENTGITASFWHHRYSGSYPGKGLIDKGDFSSVNEFIRNYFSKLNSNKYIDFIIGNYISSYDVSQHEFQFLSLCICLEAVIEGTNELNYRLRRSVAIICGENEYIAEFIFQNLKKVYTLRSKIVHGGDFDIQKVIDYTYYLRAIVSRLLIELLIHDIPSTKLLDDIITKIGFGDRNKISKNWKNYDFNVIAYSEANYTKLT